MFETLADGPDRPARLFPKLLAVIQIVLESFNQTQFTFAAQQEKGTK